MKLNKTNRQEIMDKALDAAFRKRDATHQKQRTALADALYQHVYGEGEKIAKKLPRDWATMKDGFQIVCDGFKTWGSSDGAPKTLRLSRSRHFPPYAAETRVERNHPLYGQAQEVVTEHNAIEAAKEELRTKLRTLLYSVNTTEKLAETWPEGAKFLPVEVPKVASNLPVPHNLVAQVNDMMGIRATRKAA